MNSLPVFLENDKLLRNTNKFNQKVLLQKYSHSIIFFNIKKEMSYQASIISLCIIAIILLIPPLVWHSHSKNIPAIILITWLLIMNLTCIVNAVIWSGDDFMTRWDGKGWCDLVIKLQVGANVGISCCVTNVVYNLYEIIRADKVLLELNSWRRIIKDLSISLITPIMVMGFSYLLQVFRYGITRYNGCQNLLTPTWITTVLYTMWMVIWSIIGAIFAGLVLWNFYQKRKDVGDILHCTNSGLNITRFARLLIFCLLILLVMFPFSIYTFVVELHQLHGSYSFEETHTKNIMWDVIYKFDISHPIYNIWLYILMSYLVFLIFGLGKDALRMYTKILRRVGLGCILDKYNTYMENHKQSRANKVLQKMVLPTYNNPFMPDIDGKENDTDDISAWNTTPTLQEHTRPTFGLRDIYELPGENSFEYDEEDDDYDIYNNIDLEDLTISEEDYMKYLVEEKVSEINTTSNTTSDGSESIGEIKYHYKLEKNTKK
ncbi:hypothetical protein TBLA_0J01070 [Henningerozyma blattae CBS 6284]|uniref:Pheromone a factor receptor n=1 Tax=Henningerozyma blattae (strain ATCC 34711 / CBS 6284 / DSM 70876 / NBRC 10599 / NRRL Y-10934 / UCD 77-7) TaxID=1071380 RepID=I2H9Q3_HENB6|nr:hypothetical protein TBLA_0J01070 [Tetrapisispora blattae CBS 6284]CCH63105.1 hypothetical protein TBLA_0J01070 [Tetrapisispora blattae CBS 6284]